MRRPTRTAVTFLAGGLAGAAIALPAVAIAAPTTGYQTPRPAATSDQARPGSYAGNGMNGGSPMTGQQAARMVDQCQQVMQTPQMQTMRQQMSQHMDDSMMNGSMMGRHT